MNGRPTTDIESSVHMVQAAQIREETAVSAWSRRGAMQLCAGSIAAVAGASGVIPAALAEPINSPENSVKFGRGRLRFADLTHRLTSAFNMGMSPPRISMEPVEGSGSKVGMRMHRLSLIEHTGTHIDAPSHFDPQGLSLGDIPLSDLIVPLVIVDIAARARQDRNSQVEPDDILRWERRYGRLPDGCCVAMYSDWKFPSAEDRNTPLRSFPSTGFSLEAVRMLAEKRSVKGIAVDAMTLDSGPHVPEYPVHQFWLRAGRWGIEGITNLTAIPQAGALLVVGAAPIADATGFPIRAVALY